MRETLSSHRIVGRRNLALAAAFVSLWWLPCECAAVPGSAGSPAAPQPAPTSGPSEAERVASHRRDHWRRVALTAEHIDSEPVAHDLPLYIDRYRQACIYDPILTVYRVEAKPTGADHPTSVSLEGEVLLDWYRTGTERMLRELGFDVTTNTVALLPDGRLGPLRYAVATTVSATMRRRPMMDAEQVNSLALGWPMRLLREAVPEDAVTTGGAAGPLPHGGHSWFLAQGCDGYVGFVRDD